MIKYQALCCHSATKLCPTLCDPMDCSMPGFPVLHYLPEFAQTHPGVDLKGFKFWNSSSQPCDLSPGLGVGGGG